MDQNKTYQITVNKSDKPVNIYLSSCYEGKYYMEGTEEDGRIVRLPWANIVMIREKV